MKKITIIIPCFNEEEGLPHLFTKLLKLRNKIDEKFICKIIFINDGSSDKTGVLLEEYKENHIDVVVHHHDVNKNLGASLKTGIKLSVGSDYLLFLDSDCTYDPDLIISMAEMLNFGADLVTVSPYHPMGKIEGVPWWRLILSKSLSFVYRIILFSPYFTYTAMVRGVRSEKVSSLLNARDDFSFVAEFFIRAIRLNYKIVELPATLKIRKFGVSKMNLMKTMKSHFGIILDILCKKN